MKELIGLILMLDCQVCLFTIAYYTVFLQKKENNEQFKGFWTDVMWPITIAGGKSWDFAPIPKYLKICQSGNGTPAGHQKLVGTNILVEFRRACYIWIYFFAEFACYGRVTSFIQIAKVTLPCWKMCLC